MKLMKVPALPALCSDITDEMAIALAIGAVAGKNGPLE